MDITNSEKIYKTTLAQRNAAYRYAKIEKVKKTYYYKQEVKKFLNILLDEIEEIEQYIHLTYPKFKLSIFLIIL